MTKAFFIPDRSAFSDDALNETFREQGYVILKNFLPKSVPQSLTKWYERNLPEINSGFHTSIHSNDFSHRRSVTAEVRGHLDGKLSEVLNDYRPVFSSFTVKEPDTNSGFDLHLDWSMVDEKKFTSITVWTPLVDITDCNGYLWLLERSHRFHYTIRGGPGLNLWCEKLPTQWKEKFQLKRIKLSQGDVLIYDHRLFHGSPPNTSEKRRLAINHTLIPAEANSLHYQFEGHAKVYAVEVADDFYHSHILNTTPSSGKAFSESNINGAFVFQHAVNELAIDRNPETRKF